MMIIPVEIPPEHLSGPEMQRQIALLRGFMYFYEIDPLSRQQIAVHEAAHKIYFARLGWKAEFGGAKIVFEEGQPVLVMGRVIVTGVTDADVDQKDRIAVAKAHVAPSIIVPRLTGHDDWPSAVVGDTKLLQDCLRIDDVLLEAVVEHARISVLEDLNEESFRQAIWDSASEFEAQFFKPLSAEKF